MMGNKNTHTHTPRKCNTYSFCTSAVVMRTRLSVTLHVQARLVNLVTTRGWVVSFTPRLFYLQGSASLFPLNRMQVGLQSLSERLGENMHISRLPGFVPRFFGFPSRSVVCVTTRRFGFRNKNNGL